MEKKVIGLPAGYRDLLFAQAVRRREAEQRAAELALIIWSAMQGILLSMKAGHSSAPLLEARQILRTMVDSYVNALAAGEYPAR